MKSAHGLLEPALAPHWPIKWALGLEPVKRVWSAQSADPRVPAGAGVPVGLEI
jgi:hypothetical protein